MVKKPAVEVAAGISALGRSKTYKRRAVWAVKKKNGGQFPVHSKAEAEAAPAVRAPRFYPADDVPKPLSHKAVHKPTKLRSSITPGTVLILLAGRFKGKRVVFLKQLPSGLLLVTGPFKLNGVPVRRVNQVYVIATSTKVELPQLDLSAFDDKYFKSVEVKRSKKGEKEFFDASQAQKKELAAQYIANQKALDAALLPAVPADLKAYLSARFTLKDGDRPHLMNF
ncbi:ribosomal protein L6 component of cytosolic 80S ribosome and 60S large subunit [Haematococcus lacustris]